MNKDTILKQLNETELALRVLSLSNFPRGNISSPFARDTNPSFKLNKDGSFKCFSTGKQGDVWQLIADLHNIDCKNNFQEVLTKATYYANLLPPQPIDVSFLQAKDAQKPEIFSKPLEKVHLEYWSKFGVDKFILDKFKVQALDKINYEKNGKPKTLKMNKTYGFVFFCHNHKTAYIPKQEGFGKFYMNLYPAEAIFGLEHLNTDNPFLIVCAGQKDCLVLNALGFPAICFKSEEKPPTPDMVGAIKIYLKSSNSKIYVLYDNDEPGARQKKKIAPLLDATLLSLPPMYNDVADFALLDAKMLCATLLEQINTSVNTEYSTPTMAVGAVSSPRQGVSVSAVIGSNNSAPIDASPISASAGAGVPFSPSPPATPPNTQHNNGSTIFHITEQWLSKNYDLRYNTSKLEFESKKTGTKEWQNCNENNLYIELQKSGINVSIDRLISIMKSDYVKKFDPFMSYFEGLKWDNKSHIDDLASHVHCADNKSFAYHFKKWLVRAVKCAIIPHYFNKQAFILVQDKQNSGKSTFCRFLCPPALSDHIAEDFTVDKDARIMLAKNLLINLDELATLSKHDVNVLKTYFSKTQINERLPYDRKNSILQRTCSFIGSTNMDEFLNDETGSVRWLCFKINAINFAYKNEIDINQVWAEAYHLSKSDFDCELSPKDIEENEKRNKDFAITTNEQNFVRKYVRKPQENETPLFVNSSDILVHIQLFVGQACRLSSNNIGKAMKNEGYERIKKNGIYGYNVILMDYMEAKQNLF